MARYHINRLGRFSAPDPVAGSTGDPQTLDGYAYVGNDPVDLIDPLGLCPGWGPVISNGQIYCLQSRFLGFGLFGNVVLFGDGHCNEGGCLPFWIIPLGPGALLPNPPTDLGSLTKDLRKKLKDALKNVAERCKDVLPLDKLKSLSNAIEFFDGQKPSGEGSLKASDIFPSGSDTTLSQLIQPGDAALVITDRTGTLFSNNVVIGRAWNVLNNSQQRAVLVHEATHIVKQMNDTGLWNFAQSHGAVPTGNSTDPSFNFTKWIEAGCPDQKGKP